MLWFIATRNTHKVSEIQAVLPASIRCLTLGDFPDAPVVVEDAPTFASNVTRKAVALATWLVQQEPALQGRFAGQHLQVLADDSGLEVDALDGAPGVHSARFAALEAGTIGNSNSPDIANNAKLLRLLAQVAPPLRTARFRCVIALTPADLPTSELERATRLFEGVCEGQIGLSPKGCGGFGYDPLFIPQGQSLTFAELGEAIKNQISHRARALEQLRSCIAQPLFVS